MEIRRASRRAENLNPKNIKIKDKNIWIVDDHQYTLPIWGRLALETKKSYSLVSIDYHPDTNPPFWLYCYQKAMAKDPLKEKTLVYKYQKEILKKINAAEIKTLEPIMEKMQNDEHINTALSLGYLSDFHMMNCMEKHEYTKGHHYLIKKEHFGSLRDQSFYGAGFGIEQINKLPYILDIDLDYFIKFEEFHYRPKEMVIFTSLVKQAKMLTIARSQTYFDYLKEEDFSIEECEEALINLISKILEN